MSNIQNVLWTSGWDSTFRMIKLIEKKATIQPIYVLDEGRFSRHKELETIALLKDKIISRYKNNGGVILDLLIINKKDIKFNLMQKIAYMRLKKRTYLGSQYYWLSCLSLKIKNLELSVHSDEFSFLKGNTIIINDNFIGKYFILNPKNKDRYLKRIFKNMRFPIYDFNKCEMKSIAIKEDFIDIMNLTWFCHKSDVKPCKKCTPCKQVVRDGMGYRLNE